MSKKMNPNVSSRDYVDREYWAASPHATQEELDFLSNDKSWEVRKEVAKNINSSQKTLNKLAKDNGVYVKEAVAANPNLSEETFIYLFDQSFYASLYKQVKENLLQNPNLPVVLRLRAIAQEKGEGRLINDLSSSMKNLSAIEKVYLAMNELTSSEDLDILGRSEFEGVRYAVAGNPNTTPETLDRLSREDSSVDVRDCVANNPSTSSETLAHLMDNDPEKIVRESAEFFLHKRNSDVVLD